MSKELAIENALIKSTSLGHGGGAPCMTCFVNVEFDSGGIGFGGYALDEHDKEQKDRVGTAYGLQFIMEILRVVGVDDWEKLPGKNIRVEHEGWGGRVTRIGHITKNVWFSPEDLFQRMKEAEAKRG